VREGDVALTWRDWNDYADLIADALAGRRLGARDVIAVRCRNRVEWAVIACAAAKIDAAILALAPDMPVEQVRAALIASEAAALICDDDQPALLRPAIAGLPLRLCATLDVLTPGFFNFWDLVPPVAQPRFARSQPRLIALTSGAGGAPAGVAIPHQAAMPALLSPPPVADDGAQLITLSLHRSWAQQQMWDALADGRRSVLVRTFDAAVVLATLTSERITRWCATPAAFAALAALPAATIAAADLSSLQELAMGGAPGAAALKDWVARVFGPILTEVYGATETGPIAAMPATAGNARPGSCGRPQRGVMVEIRDATGRPLPPNCNGQIWARTRRSLEADLLPGPIASRQRDEAGFVATGDAGHVDEDGFLFVTGRTDAREIETSLRLM
jgi:long-chain acyl-CoA synthetase